MSFLSEEDQQIADELQKHIEGGDLLDELDLFGGSCHECTGSSTEKKGGDVQVDDKKSIKYDMTSVAISDSNDIRRVIADMLK